MSDNLPEPRVHLSSIPELATILRRGLLSKVRIFEAWCMQGDRLAEVVRVGGRPLAIARELRGTSVMYMGAPEKNGHKMRNVIAARIGMWLDMDPGVYYVQEDPPPVGESRPVHPLMVSGQCRHEHVPIPADWLRTQVGRGVRKRVIDAAARREMGTRPRGT